MRSKYILRKHKEAGTAFGLRYDEDRKEVLVGGSYRFADDMRAIVVGLDQKEIHTSHDGMRVRVVVYGVSSMRWLRLLKSIAGEYGLEQVDQFRRLMG